MVNRGNILRSPAKMKNDRSFGADNSMNEVRELNKAWLMFAQRLLREDVASGARDLGLPNEAARVLAELSHEQLDRLAHASQMLCRFRFSDHAVLQLLADKITRDTIEPVSPEQGI